MKSKFIKCVVLCCLFFGIILINYTLASEVNVTTFNGTSNSSAANSKVQKVINTILEVFKNLTPILACVCIFFSVKLFRKKKILYGFLLILACFVVLYWGIALSMILAQVQYTF